MPKAAAASPPTWGRVIIAGGADWASNGKPRRSQTDISSDLSSPHILRALSHLKITQVISGSSANYAIAIDDIGVAHLFGKLPALSPDPRGIVPAFDAVHVSPRAVGLAKGVTWVGGAVGRAHFFLIDSKGGVWGAGMNTIGQLGLPITSDPLSLARIDGPWGKDKIVQVTAGLTFSLFLTSKGQVYACGSCEHGQLGSGTTGERIVKGNKLAYDAQTPPRLVGGDLEDKVVAQIASGSQHSLALDNEGYVYAWGYAGYARLGLGDQKDKLTPTVIPQFLESNPLRRAKAVYAGPSSSIVVDAQGMFHIAGKWKMTGDGSGGSPYTSFKQLPEISGCKIEKAAFGGVTHFITTYLDAEKTQVQTIAWGQGALCGELGLGPDCGKSSTKPLEVAPLRGVNVIDVAASQFFSIFLAHPNAELTELDRWPLVVEAPTLCIACSQNREPDEPAMECERCDAPYHPSCLNPPLAGPPEGEWFCPKCMAESKQTFDDVPLADFAAHEASPSTPGAPESLKRPPSSQGFSAAPGKKLRAE